MKQDELRLTDKEISALATEAMREMSLSKKKIDWIILFGRKLEAKIWNLAELKKN